MSKEKENFIEDIINNDINNNDNNLKETKFRFPPEANSEGIHLGHVKSLCLNFGLAEKYNSTCNLRFDDTNPANGNPSYMKSMIKDIEWLGFKPTEIKRASDYFGIMYKCAEILINKGLAYVDDSTSEEIADMKGTPTNPGIDSSYKKRSKEENLKLFRAMKNGDFEDGSKVLRANIDMNNPNMILRDPILYRIMKVNHPMTKDKWNIYPMYDFAHPLSDYLENITHSICTLEFEVHRPLYEWVLENCDLDNPLPKQIEFARLNLSHNIMSKRKINDLIDKGYLVDWDDPRLTTVAGLKRRGYTPESIINFCHDIGVAKRNSLIDIKRLEAAARDHLNEVATRVMGVMNPLKVTITNYPEGKMEYVMAKNHPTDEVGTRKVPFSRNLYIEREDFMENAPRKFFRLTENKEVRFKYAYYITCNEVIKDDAGNVIELKCTYDPKTKGGWSDDGRKVKGTIHWVSADYGEEVEVKLYSPPFLVENVEDHLKDFDIDSVTSVNAVVEPAVKDLAREHLQFERVGYFISDSHGNFINRTVPLRDTKPKKL